MCLHFHLGFTSVQNHLQVHPVLQCWLCLGLSVYLVDSIILYLPKMLQLWNFCRRNILPLARTHSHLLAPLSFSSFSYIVLQILRKLQVNFKLFLGNRAEKAVAIWRCPEISIKDLLFKTAWGRRITPDF